VRTALLYNRADGNNMMNILVILHSTLRWIILLVAVIAIIKFALGWLQGSAFKGLDRGLMSGFSGLMDLEATIGLFSLILILWNQNRLIESNDPVCARLACFFPLYAVVHGVIMSAAAIVAHLPARWKNTDDNTRFRKNTFAILVSLVLVLVGIFVLRFRPELF
jgi:hypothetical protein